MKRAITAALACLCLLTGCGSAPQQQDVEKILARYETAQRIEMTARVCCEYEHERREYTLRCIDSAQGESSVEVLSPEELCGVRAIVGGEETYLQYDDLLLDAALLGTSKLSPAEILPRLLEAMREGWLLEQSREEGAEELLRLCFETEGAEEKLYWTVWLNEETGAVTAAEVTEGEELFFTMEFTDFVFGDILLPDITQQTTD